MGKNTDKKVGSNNGSVIDWLKNIYVRISKVSISPAHVAIALMFFVLMGVATSTIISNIGVTGVTDLNGTNLNVNNAWVGGNKVLVTTDNATLTAGIAAGVVDNATQSGQIASATGRLTALESSNATQQGLIAALQSSNASQATQVIVVTALTGAAIQAAIDGCNGYCQVYLPKGTYALTTPIRINKSGVHLMGAGPSSTIITIPANSTGIRVGEDPSSYISMTQIENIKFNLATSCNTGSANDNTIAIYTNYSKFLYLDNIDATGLCGIGVYLNGWARYNQFRNLNIQMTRGPALKIYSADPNLPNNDNLITNSRLYGEQAPALILDANGEENMVTGNLLQSNNSDVVHWGESSTATKHNTLSNNQIQYRGEGGTNTFTGVVSNGSQYGVISNNNIFGYSATEMLNMGVNAPNGANWNRITDNKFSFVTTYYNNLENSATDNYEYLGNFTTLYANTLTSRSTTAFNQGFTSGNNAVWTAGSIYMNNGNLYGVNNLQLNNTNAEKITMQGAGDQQIAYYNSTGSQIALLDMVTGSRMLGIYERNPNQPKLLIRFNGGNIEIANSNLEMTGHSVINMTGGVTNQAVCWKAGGTLGYCSTTVNATGGCTCT